MVRPYIYSGARIALAATVLKLVLAAGTPACGESVARPPSTPAAHAEGGAKTGITLAERRLLRILAKEQDVFAQLEAGGERINPMERERLVNEVLSEYQSFVFDNPNYSYGFILYGKLLRRVGDYEAANMAFVRANQIDPNQAVVKQQIGNYLAEEGEFSLALPYFVAAIDLEPGVAVYPFQLGTLLHTFADSIVERGLLERAALEREMLTAFARAHALEPGNTTYTRRYAEAFFDVDDPDWKTALRLWQQLGRQAQESLDLDLIKIQQARVRMAMGQIDEAENLLSTITRPSLAPAVESIRRQTQP